MISKEEADEDSSLVPVQLEMFCWGNTANGELGLGGIEDHQILSPRELIFKDVNQVKYGLFTLLLLPFLYYLVISFY